MKYFKYTTGFFYSHLPPWMLDLDSLFFNAAANILLWPNAAYSICQDCFQFLPHISSPSEVNDHSHAFELDERQLFRLVDYEQTNFP